MKTSTRIALAVSTALLSTTAFAADEKLKVYGKANIGFLVTDTSGDSFTDVESFASRFGAKGTYKLDNGLSAIYKFEWQVNIDDKEDNLTARSQYVGLKGDFGQVSIGRHDTSFKLSQGKVDLFNDYKGDIKKIWKGENRLNETLQYVSPSFSGFKVSGTYIAEASGGADSGFSLAAMYGDAKLKKSNVYASIAADSEVKGYDAIRATVQAKFGDFKLGAMVQQWEPASGGDSDNGVMINAAYKLDKLTLKGQFQTATPADAYELRVNDSGEPVVDVNGNQIQDLVSEDLSLVSVGADYKLGKATKAYVWFTNKEYDKSGNKDESNFALGLEHKF